MVPHRGRALSNKSPYRRRKNWLGRAKRAESPAKQYVINQLDSFSKQRAFKTWGSRRDADLLLQVMAAVLNGEFDALLRPGSVSHAAHEDQYDLLPLAA
jgi:hypothetical protein